MKVFLSLFLFVLLFSNCRLVNQDAHFDRLVREYSEKRSNIFPEIPVGNTLSAIQNPTSTRFEEAISYFTKINESLKKIEYSELNVENQSNYDKIDNEIKSSLTYLQDSSYSWNPAFYNVGGILKNKLSTPNLDLCERLTAINADLEKIPVYYETAKSNLKDISIQKTLLAINKNSHGFHFLKNEVLDSLKSSNCEAINDSTFLVKRNKSLIAIKDYVAFCNSLKFEYKEENSLIVFRDSL